MKSKVDIKLSFTISKILGIIIAILGSYIGYLMNSEAIIITAITTGAGLVGFKTFFTSRYDNGYNNQNYEETGHI